ncbi:hypothetical protein AB0I98_48170, partial [Streptomyces sp. NPDC050211]|uniref:hypothetical protein n=1 Tax=Streptomyces sp. NPDC050211 TaxID=3154932 RepID=UPI0034422F43
MTRWEIRRPSAVRRRPSVWKTACGDGPPSTAPNALDRPRASPLDPSDTTMLVVSVGGARAR